MNIHTVFAQRPTIRTVVQLKAPLEITAPTSQLVKLRHVGVGFAPPALPGNSGAGDLHYTHNQGAAADVWNITHNLGKRPSVTVQDSANDEVEGNVGYTDLNHLTITFSAAFSGVAYLN